jgi:hypothetical protein
VCLVFAVPRPAPAGPGPIIPGVPPYYAALTATPLPSGQIIDRLGLTVRSTVTSKVLATVTPPHPYGQFMLVDGTAGDRTFIVGAQVWPPHPRGSASVTPEPVRLFLLHFDLATDKATLSVLPLPQFSGLNLETASISPDGTRVAVAYENGRTAGEPDPRLHPARRRRAHLGCHPGPGRAVGHRPRPGQPCQRRLGGE